MSLLNRLASLTPTVPPGAALAGTVTIVGERKYRRLRLEFPTDERLASVFRLRPRCRAL
jgi:hypothetical protein